MLLIYFILFYIENERIFSWMKKCFNKFENVFYSYWKIFDFWLLPTGVQLFYLTSTEKKYSGDFLVN